MRADSITSVVGFKEPRFGSLVAFTPTKILETSIACWPAFVTFQMSFLTADAAVATFGVMLLLAIVGVDPHDDGRQLDGILCS